MTLMRMLMSHQRAQRGSSQMFVDDLHSSRNPVFLGDLFAKSSCAKAHFSVGSCPNRVGQLALRQTAGRNGRWTHTELEDTVSPKRLVREHRHNDGRQTSPESGPRHPRATMMHSRAYSGEQPSVRNGVDAQDLVAKSPCR